MDVLRDQEVPWVEKFAEAVFTKELNFILCRGSSGGLSKKFTNKFPRIRRRAINWGKDDYD